MLESSSQSFAFAKANRVLQRADFQAAYSQGKSYRRKAVHLFVQSREAGDLPTRLGITTTKKLGNAVVRNRLRRLAREAFRLTLPELQSGFTVIVNFHKSAIDLKMGDIQKQIRSVFQEAGMMCETPPMAEGDGVQ